MNLTKEQIVALQEEISKLGGRKKYIESELKRRGIVIEKRRSMKDFTDKKRKEEYIKNREIEEDVRSELKTLTWSAYKTQNISYLGEGIFWNDSLGVDFFDPYERTVRRKDNDVPEIESIEDVITALQEAVSDLDVSKLRWFCYHRDVAEVVHYETFAIPKKTLNLDEVALIALTAAATFSILDTYIPSMGVSARSGAGLGIGANLVGFPAGR